MSFQKEALLNSKHVLLSHDAFKQPFRLASQAPSRVRLDALLD